MKMLRNSLFAVAALACLGVQPALASKAMYCAPTNGSRQVTNPNTTTSYTLNGRGCALISAPDIGYFASQGYVLLNPAVIAYQLTSTGSVILPASSVINSITIQEDSGGSMLGANGVRIGTTANGTDIVAAANVAASGYTVVPDVSTLKRAFSATVPQSVFFSAASYSTGPRYTVTINYSYF